MTRPGHRLDLFDRHAPIRKPATTNPWAGYLRCDECGAEPDAVCRDLDDRPAVEVCDGRRMVDDFDENAPNRRQHRRPTVACTPTGPAVGTSERALQRRRNGTTEAPVMVPCVECGTPVRKWGHGARRCTAPECHRAKRRAEKYVDKVCACCGKVWRTTYKAARYCSVVCRRDAFRLALYDVTVPCHWCQTPCPAGGPAQSRKTARHPTCGDPSCARATKRIEQGEARARRAAHRNTVIALTT